MDKIDDNFDAAEKIWSPLIGQFILDFGYIEDDVHTVIKRYVSATLIPQSAITERFDQRFSLCCTILRSLLTTDEERAKIAEIENTVASLKRTRNLLAHNPLTINFSEDASGELTCVGFEITSSRKNENSILLLKLRKEAEELNLCRKTMTGLIVDFLCLMPKDEPAK